MKRLVILVVLVLTACGVAAASGDHRRPPRAIRPRRRCSTRPLSHRRLRRFRRPRPLRRPRSRRQRAARRRAARPPPHRPRRHPRRQRRCRPRSHRTRCSSASTSAPPGSGRATADRRQPDPVDINSLANFVASGTSSTTPKAGRWRSPSTWASRNLIGRSVRNPPARQRPLPPPTTTTTTLPPTTTTLPPTTTGPTTTGPTTTTWADDDDPAADPVHGQRRSRLPDGVTPQISITFGNRPDLDGQTGTLTFSTGGFAAAHLPVRRDGHDPLPGIGGHRPGDADLHAGR